MEANPYKHVEGGELEALQTMYWNIPGDFWVIELDNSNTEKDRAVSDLLLSIGYLLSKWNIRSACTKGMDCSSKLMFSKRNVGNGSYHTRFMAMRNATMMGHS